MKKNLLFLMIGLTLFPISQSFTWQWPWESPPMTEAEKTAAIKSQLKPLIRATQELTIEAGETAGQTGAETMTQFFKGAGSKGEEAGEEAAKAATQFASGMNKGVQEGLLPELKKLSNQAVSSAFNMENALQIGVPMALTIGIPIVTTIGLKYAKQKILHPKPEIIESEAYPKYGRLDRLQRWWAGYKSPSMILNKEIADHLNEIQEKTKNIRNHIFNGDKQATYTNLLLSGPPGTGKTLFARVLSDYTDMDFLPVSGARLLQSELAFSEVVDMAKNSTYGTIIFIDEADALFIDRQTLLTSKSPGALSQYKALNHILGITGQKNNKYMIIAATNNPHVLDEAMDRRFPDTIEMTLPNSVTRLALLNLYIGNQLFNEKNNTKEFITAARALLTPAVLQEITQKTEGFSYAKIEDMIKAMRDSARATKSGIITQSGIDNAISRAIKKHQDLEKNKEKRAKLFDQQPEQQKPAPTNNGRIFRVKSMAEVAK